MVSKAMQFNKQSRLIHRIKLRTSLQLCRWNFFGSNGEYCSTKLSNENASLRAKTGCKFQLCPLNHCLIDPRRQ